MQVSKRRTIGTVLAALALAAAAAILPASPAAAQAQVKLYGTSNGANFCLNHNASAVPCSTTSARWIMTVADSSRNAYRLLAVTGNWTTCLEQQAGTDHLRRVTCAWNSGQIWTPTYLNPGNQWRSDYGACLDMNRTGGIPNGVVTATGCNGFASQQWIHR
ncbi:hypothetical protein [Paractinoplanes rishiriensis]|uniref:Ricin B lectin domain-containing protein n=1 Tax=Paractinoplanes rishiriensis TaxID=1050105 RepID=A0A919K3A1_9ACTN|nr:hypothetical protein [Actinoplanes rishiriensis]GIE98729.1 hypothetical protein Ari01nite_61940 [Actinoplanes rishiriensis]